MRLQDELPRGVTVRGRFVKLNLDFRNVLKLIETLARDDLTPEARDWLALRCITRKPRNTPETLQAAKKLLFPAQHKNPTQAKITDFEQDADLIRAAFRQVYGIDLWRDRLHWLEFSALLAGLPEGNRYNDVLGIRARPLPAPTKYNAEERKWLIQAKADLALHMTEKERRESYEKSARGLAESLLALAATGQKAGETTDGS